MSVIIGKGYMISCLETEAQCPICTAKFDVGEKMEKAKYPVFKMKCPKCKGKITVSTPMFSSDKLKCWETECPKNVERLESETPFKVNGIEVK
jgi:ssDNA-binding Zn-finger/Zn-ribbon topoisomerase 1